MALKFCPIMWLVPVPGRLFVTQRFFYKRNAAMILLRVLRRMTMKACIDAVRPNSSPANYFEGLWRITSKINAKIQVRKQ